MIETDERSCGSSIGNHKGIQTKKDVFIKTSKEIQVKTKYYSFNCLDYDGYKSIKNKQLDSTKTIDLAWNNVNFKYE